MIKLNNITKKYNNKVAINNASFKIYKNKINCLVGRNGAGKTTLIKILLKQINQDQGTVEFSEDISAFDISYLAEERGLYTKHTVVENIGYFCDLSGSKNKDAEIKRVLKEFEIEKYANVRVDKLSKGNAQKVQLACVFAPQSKVIILDEPFSGLDYINSIKLSNIIKKYAKTRYMIISTHQMKFVDDFADNLLVISDSEVKFSGLIEEMKKKSELYFLIENTHNNVELLKQHNLEYKVKDHNLVVKNITKELVNELIIKFELATFSYDYLKTSDIIVNLVGGEHE